jgi:aspartate aminotransferase
MAIATDVKAALASSSMIRKMFEEGAALKKIHGADNVFDFSLGNPDLEPPEAFHRTLLTLVSEDAKGSHGYMSNAGFEETRSAIASKVTAEQNVALTAASIVMSVGAAGALNTVFKTLLNPNDEVVVTKPYFMEYRSYAANFRGKIQAVPARSDFSLNLNAISAALSPATAAVLINSPNNPTGRVYPESDLHALAAILADHSAKTGRATFLIADEPYRDIIFDGRKTPPVLPLYKNTIIVNSYSKSLSLAGERIGYIAVNPACDDAGDVMNGLIYSTRVLGYVNAPALMQRCVARLTSETVDVAVYEARRDAFKDVLDNAGIEYAEPEGAFYLFAKAPLRRGEQGPVGDDMAFSDHLKKYLILGVPGSGFACPGYLRFAYCVSDALIRRSKDAFLKAAEAWKR